MSSDLTQVTPARDPAVTASPLTDLLSRPARQRRPWRRRALPRRRVIDAVVLLPCVALAGWLLGAGLTRTPGFSDDEGTYVAQAWAVLHLHQLAHYTYWYDHPPFGWIQLAAFNATFGQLVHTASAVGQGRVFALVCSLLAAALVFVWARRLRLSRPAAALALLAFVASPLSVHYLRMAFLDTFALPWVIAAFALATTRRHRLWVYTASGLCFAAAVLTKETMLVLLPALLVQVWAGTHRRTRAFCLTGFLVAFVLVLAAYPLLAVLKGELLPGPGHVSLIDAIRFQLFSRPSTGSLLVNGTGSHALASEWLHLDRWLLLGGAVACIPALWLRTLRPPALAVITLLLMGVRPGYLPDAYVVGLLPFAAILLAGVGDAAVRALRDGSAARRSRALGAAAVAGLVALAATAAPAWAHGDEAAMTANSNSAQVAAERWLGTHVQHRARLLVDDSYYVDLVHEGFRPGLGVIWFYKLDATTSLDPSVRRALPQGWRALDYVVSSPVIRSAVGQSSGGLTPVRDALQHSRVVATFGRGPGRVEIRRVTGGTP